MKRGYDDALVREKVPAEAVPGEVRCQYLRPGELLGILGAFPVAYQPIGTLEWHGRQNPLGCDSIKAEALCVAVARQIGGVVMPPLYFSTDGYKDAGHGLACGMDACAGFELPGSFYKADSELLKNLLLTACRNYLGRGFKLVVLVSGHNPRMQQYLMDEVCYTLKTDTGAEPACFTMEYMVLPPNDPRRYTDHAGFYETSMMLYLKGDRVRMQANEGPQEPDLAIMTERPVAEASAAEGEAAFRLQVRGLAELTKKKLALL